MNGLIRLLFIFFTAAACVQGQSGLDTPVAVGKYFNSVFPPSAPGGAGGWQAVNAFPSLQFIDPVKVVAQPKSNRLHVLGKDGFVWSFENNASTTVKTNVLDIRSRVQSTDNAGLVGIAFHPEFGMTGSPRRGYVYLFYYYSPQPKYLPALDTNSDGIVQGDETLRHTALRLSRFTFPDGSLTIDPASELVLLQQYDRQAWHNGGSLCFGNDGFLYFAIGDEGLDSDYYRSMQKFTGRLWGGVFRIDVDMNPARSHPIRRQPQYVSDGYGDPLPLFGGNHTYSQAYYIPNDNPWLHADGSQLEEYWALGVRSPHTMTCDPETGNLWLGDVGQAQWEEINLVKRSGDYQWPYMEGNSAFFDSDFGQGWIAKTHSRESTPEPPIHSYSHDSAGGTAVIGGYVYRGQQHAAALNGKYLFSDHGNPTISHVWALTPGSPAAPVLLCDLPAGGFHWNIAAWGRDHSGEPLMVMLGRESGASAGNAFIPPLNSSGQWVTKAANGRIFKLTRTLTNIPEPPLKLSQTGVFQNVAGLSPAPAFIPYQPIAPFWSDGAAKQRWLCIPNDGTHDATTERIGWSASEPWTFPEGTVFMKQFDLPVDDSNPALTKRLETRFMVNGTAGWYGLTYRWRVDGGDADLIFGAETRDFTIPATGGGARMQQWIFPSRSDCIACHSPNTGSVLGCNTHQLGTSLTYPVTGRSGHQLKTLRSLGILNPAPSDAVIQAAPRACDPLDLSQSLELRARSYLDTNCAACHRPGGANANWDARFTTPLASALIINGALKKSYGISGEAAVRAHDPGRSILYIRSNQTGAQAMPPLAKNRIDAAGMETVRAWINSLSPAAWPAPGAPQPPDGPPTAMNDAATLLAGTTLTFPLTGNDVDQESNLNPNSIQLVRQPARGTVSFTPAASAAYTHTGSWGTDTFSYTVADAAGRRSNEALVTLTIQRPQDAWLAVNFSLAQQSNPLISGWDADPDGDGNANLLEYAGGTLPLDGTSSPQLTAVRSGPVMTVTFPRNTFTSVVLSAETSTPLSGWVPTGYTVTENSATRFIVSVPVNVNVPRKFIRIHAALP